MQKMTAFECMSTLTSTIDGGGSECQAKLPTNWVICEWIRATRIQDGPVFLQVWMQNRVTNHVDAVVACLCQG